MKLLLLIALISALFSAFYFANEDAAEGIVQNHEDEDILHNEIASIRYVEGSYIRVTSLPNGQGVKFSAISFDIKKNTDNIPTTHVAMTNTQSNIENAQYA